MSAATLSLLLLSSLAAYPIPDSGSSLTYRGTFEALKGNPLDSRKSFELTLIFQQGSGKQAPEQQASLAWILREEGFGGWPWTDRFGQYELKTSGASEGHVPSLLYLREAGASVVPLPAPWLGVSRELSAGQQWSEGRLEYEVDEAETKAGRVCWPVRVSSPYGPKRTVWLDRQTGIIVASVDNVTIGQGERHVLQMELVDQSQLAKSSLRLLDQLAQVRTSLGIEPRTREVNWSAEQLDRVRQQLGPLAESGGEDAVGQLLAAAVEETKDQKGRDNAVSAMRKLVLDKPLKPLQLQDQAGTDVDLKDWQGKVTILHFWEYRDLPLEEPYGQVGYLDFLYRQRKDDGVRVYGVVVNDDLANREKRSGVLRSAKKFQSFMRLSYPLLVDTGSALRELGDPRTSGAKLPLTIVVDAQGRLVHYHVGYYDVDQRRGLVELDELVTKLLKSGG